MKKTFYAALVFLFVLGAFGFTVNQRIAGILKELQIEPSNAKESIFTNFQDGVLDFPYSTMVTKFALGKREAAVKELGDFIRVYVESTEFATRYQAAREEARPQGIQSDNDKITARLEQLENDLNKIAKELMGATGNKQTALILTQEQVNKEIFSLTHPEDPQHDYYVKKLTKVKDWEKNNASEDTKAWQEAFPQTVKDLVRKRLTEFLALTKDIDFNAKLLQHGSKMVFADPALEAKSTEWKRCFRCGKETITAARSYAQQWLASLK